MTSSSLRNSIHRRNHKERSQLAHRSRLGLLEKHSDYVKRARDYHSKQDRLTRLKQKAADRNKDEFYFSMSNERTRGGVHIKDRGNAALPTDIVKVLKSQDENYVRTMRASGLKKIDKIKNQLMEMADLIKSEFKDNFTDQELKTLSEADIFPGPSIRSKKRKHIIFAESRDEAVSLQNKTETRTSSDDRPSSSISEEDLGWKSTTFKKKGKAKQLELDEEDSDLDEQLSPVDKRKRLIKELSARLGRDRQLRYAQREFEMQRLLMGKGGRKKIQAVEKIEGDRQSEEDDQDALDARKGKPRDTRKPVDEATYKPRVYKWRLERKR